MRKLLNTLYITQPQAYLHKDGMNLVVSVDQKEMFRIPNINIENIVTFGYMGASPGVMKLCTDTGIGLCFMTPNGKFISRISGPTQGNVLLRMRQYAVHSNLNAATELAKLLIQAKIHNSRQLLLRHLRDYGENPILREAQEQLLAIKRRIASATDKPTLLGMEGMAASVYFGAFNELILNKAEIFKFTSRSRRPPKDPVNLLLSFVYTLFTNEMVNALETVGLDPNVGFLHELRPGRPSLALDMIEEFRSPVCDRFVLSLLNKKQLTESHFQTQCENSVNITDEGRKILLAAWQTKKREIATHPFLNEKVPNGLLPYLQATLMARNLRGQIDNYPVYLIK